MKKMLFILLLFVVFLWGIIFFAPQLLQPGAMATGHQELSDDCFACHTAFTGPSRKKCLGCHDVKQIDNNATEHQALHSKLLHGDCTACHTNHQGRYSRETAQSFAHDVMDPASRNKCAACHQAPKNALHTRVQSSCASCHRTESWLPARFEHSTVISRESTSCADCHARPEKTGHIRSDADCGQCHQTGAWRPASFAHERYFRLDDEHDVSCSTCHPDGDFGRYTCLGCHEHSSGKLKEEHREEGIRNFQDCARCHPSGDEDEARHGRGMDQRYKNRGDSHEKHDDEHEKRGEHKHDRHHDD
jgi:hypothetical protein